MGDMTADSGQRRGARTLAAKTCADGHWHTSAALAYAVIGYTSGLMLIVARPLAANVLGVIVLAHALVIAAYLMHECMHNSVFARGADNARLGRVLGWLTGACYARYERLRDKHFRHHIERADVVAFDYRPRLACRPRLLRLLVALEWLYVPAVEVLVRALAIGLPLCARNRSERARAALVLTVRLALFACLVWVSPAAPLRYAIAYLLFLTVMRFMDAFQHTYEIFETLDQDRSAASEFDRTYEQRNTYSNLLSVRHPWLNLLTLNFAYHNAHHERPTEPWYRLRALHHELYGDDAGQVLPLHTLLKMYHRHRVRRVLQGDAPDSGIAQRKGAGFIGVDGVSFLLPI